jgi:hypothetical protein
MPPPGALAVSSDCRHNQIIKHKEHSSVQQCKRQTCHAWSGVSGAAVATGSG